MTFDLGNMWFTARLGFAKSAKYTYAKSAKSAKWVVPHSVKSAKSAKYTYRKSDNILTKLARMSAKSCM